MDNITPINQYSIPSGVQLEPPESSVPILASSYELPPSFINKIQELSFAGEGDETPTLIYGSLS